VALLTKKTGPDGTEVLVRPGRLQGAPRDKPAISLSPQLAASHLRKAVQNAEREGLRDKLEVALHHRREFWMDTCREPLCMRAASPQVMELHRRHGCRFTAPTARQVQFILNALDAAVPDWDSEHPELFYQTLELNFPELLHIRLAPFRG